MLMASFSQPFMTSSGLQVSRVWSMAGVSSSVLVQGFQVMPDGKKNRVTKESFLFDCGNIDDATKNAKNVFITHGHTGKYITPVWSCFTIAI